MPKFQITKKNLGILIKNSSYSIILNYFESCVKLHNFFCKFVWKFSSEGVKCGMEIGRNAVKKTKKLRIQKLKFKN